MNIVFLGTGDIGLPSLRALADSEDHELLAVFTQPDKPFGRKGYLKAPETKKFAQSRAVPVYQPERIRDVRVIEMLSNYDPDVIVVIAFGQILPKTVLDIPKEGCLNLHGSLLPFYRGAAPVQASILAGDEETGMTVMYVDEGLDDGDILLASRIKIAADETGGSLHDRLAELGPAILLESLELMSSGKAPRVKQDHKAATYVTKLQRLDGKIDWSNAADQIDRQVRAYDPWPGTFTLFHDGNQVKIFPPVEIVSGIGADPGQVIAADPSGILIGCGEGALRVCEIQPAGRTRMAVSAYLAGKKLEIGELLGPER